MADYGSDVVVRWLENAGIEFVTMNPGASFRGLHDSLVRSSSLQPITVLHEESAVGIAHGYAKASGKPMAVFLHNLVGLQHASMAVFNAYMDNVPMILIGGSGPRDSARRRPWLDWIHTGNIQADVVRDIVKWHSEPGSIESLAPALARAYRIATTVPMGPVYLSIDVELQEAPVDSVDLQSWPAVPGCRVTAAQEVVDQVAQSLSEAVAPAIIVDRPAPGASEALVALAEITGSAVIDLGARCTFPSDHWADQTFDRELALSEADVVLALEARDFSWATTHVDLATRTTSTLLSSSARVFSVGMTETQHRGFVDRESAISGVHQVISDVKLFLEALLAKVEQSSAADRVSTLESRHHRRRNHHSEVARAAGHEKTATLMGFQG